MASQHSRASAPPGPASDGTTGVYGITVAAELAGMSVQALRLYERKGLLEPTRTAGGTRRYSDTDIARLRRIGVLIDKGINLTGIARVLGLEADNAGLHEDNAGLRTRNAEPHHQQHRLPRQQHQTQCRQHRQPVTAAATHPISRCSDAESAGPSTLQTGPGPNSPTKTAIAELVETSRLVGTKG